ncbi:TldD/PmbA family protein, partial [Candidatus Poribacteria bacterium]|nr:TldD/PmbA family protein [Candidatus Poribacteria bacterium]
MLSREEAKKILDKVMSMSKADETEAHISGYKSSLTRFAENHIHQNVSEDNKGISVTAVIGKRMGSASTSKLDDESIKKVVSDAAEIAKLTPPEEDLMPGLGPQEYRTVDSYDPAVDNITPMDRAEAVGEIIAKCRKNNLRAAGAFSNNKGSHAIATSNGLFAYNAGTGVNFTMTAQGDNSTGWSGKSSHKLVDVETNVLGDIAVDKALKSSKTRELPPGKYTVILEPAAIDIISFMFSGFNALAVDEGRSFLAGKMGQKLLGDNITITSDPYHPLQQGSPFGGDGVPREKVLLVENGVAKNLVYDRLTAKKHNVKPTGHGSGGRNAYGAYPSNIIMKGGSSTLEEMIESTDKGILITRFWYM